MIASITSIELNGPLKFFALSRSALKIIRQLRTTKCVKFKKQGIWTKHYTMSLWNSEEEMVAFARMGAHLEAMKRSKDIAKEIRIITIETEQLPSWKEAKRLLENGKVIQY